MFVMVAICCTKTGDKFISDVHPKQSYKFHYPAWNNQVYRYVDCGYVHTYNYLKRMFLLGKMHNYDLGVGMSLFFLLIMQF